MFDRVIWKVLVIFKFCGFKIFVYNKDLVNYCIIIINISCILISDNDWSMNEKKMDWLWMGISNKCDWS